MSVEEIPCQHCPSMQAMGVFHGKVCYCTHHHSLHNFAGGCRVKGCDCERYDQTDHAVRQPRVAKEPRVTKTTEIVESVDLESLLEAAQNQAPDELIAAQARVDKLREKKKAQEEAMTKTSNH